MNREDASGRPVKLANPGGAAPTVYQFGAGAGDEAFAPPVDADARPGVNPLVDVAAPLFDLIVHLRGHDVPRDVTQLRGKTLALLEEFEARAQGVEPDRDIVGMALYALAATIDDQVMAKPGAMASGWPRFTLVASLFDEVIGGDRFFDYLMTAERAPGRYGDVLELMYVCLSLGFEGTYRQRDPGAARELEDRRRSAFEAIRERRAGFPEGLSTRWKGVETTRRRRRLGVPVWFGAALSVVAVAVLFVLALDGVGEQSARAELAFASLAPASVEILRIEPAAPEPEPPAPSAQAEAVRGFLEPEIEARLVEVHELGGQTYIRLTGDAMFESGSAEIKPAFVPVLEKVADALDDEPGRVRVEGHSDAQPLRGRLLQRFRSNQGLSTARAEAAAALLRGWLDDPDRLDIRGLGATRPRDPSDPRADINRRIELVLDRREG